MTQDPQQPPKLIRDLMTVGVVTCDPNTPATAIAEAILERDLEAVVVLDDEGHALGIVSQDELIAAYGKGDYAERTAEGIMRDGVPQIPPDLPIGVGAQLMQDQGGRVFFLMHHAGGIEYPAAVISYRHFLNHMAMKDPADLKNLGIYAERQAPLDSFLERREQQKKAGGTHLKS